MAIVHMNCITVDSCHLRERGTYKLSPLLGLRSTIKIRPYIETSHEGCPLRVDPKWTTSNIYQTTE